MQIIPQIYSKINSATEILITTHASPDGDALGSALALYHLLKKMGKMPTVVVPDKIPQFLKFLPEISTVLIYDQNPKKIQNIVAKTDYIMIDHHLQPEEFGQLYFGDPSRASTAELIYELIEQMDLLKQVNSEIATCLYTGIMTDTGSFRFPATRASTHQTVANLLKFNIEHDQIHRDVYDSNTENKIRLWGYATYEKLKIYSHYKVGIIDLNTQELKSFNTQEGYLEGLANYILTLKEVKVAIVLSEKDEKIKMSFRSEGHFPVNLMASTFFQGGGHQNAAGGFYKDTMDNTLDYLLNSVLPHYGKELLAL